MDRSTAPPPCRSSPGNGRRKKNKKKLRLWKSCLEQNKQKRRQSENMFPSSLTHTNHRELLAGGVGGAKPEKTGKLLRVMVVEIQTSTNRIYSSPKPGTKGQQTRSRNRTLPSKTTAAAAARRRDGALLTRDPQRASKAKPTAN